VGVALKLIYDFLLVINTNLPPILHRFDSKCQNRYIWLPPLAFKPPDGGFPWDDLRKIFRRCQRMAKVQNGEEKLPKILTG